MALILKHTEHRCQLVKLGHTICRGALEAHYNYTVFVQRTRLKKRLEVVLIVNNNRGRFNNMMLGLKSRIITLLPLLKERAKTHLDIAGSIGYLLGDGAVDIDDDAAELLTDDAKAILRDLDISLASAAWDLDGLKAAINAYLAKKSLKMRDIGLPLRAAVTGTKQTPSIIDIMVALGQSETSARLQIACK